MTSGSAMIAISGLTKSFGSHAVLKGVDLEISRGESLVIIGGSGTGKSVTLKCILGLLRPDGGQILIRGQDVTRLSGAKREAVMADVGMLFQGAALFDSLPVWENVAFGLIQSKSMPRKQAKARAYEVLAQVGLEEDIAQMNPAELSGGMQKRVGLARAIATTPDIIFFDEPTTGLDPIMAGMINELIVERVRELGATTLTITHDMKSARQIADKIAMIYQGKIIWCGAAGEIDSSDNPYIEQFIHGEIAGPIQLDA